MLPWSCFHVSLAAINRHTFYGLTITLILVHNAVLGSVAQDVMAKLTKPGISNFSCALTHAI